MYRFEVFNTPFQSGFSFVRKVSSAALVAVDMGLLASEVLLQLPKPAMAGVMPVTVHVKAGLANGAFKFRAV